MAGEASAEAAAFDAAVEVQENPPEPARVLRRLYSDVDACRRALEAVADAPERVEAKYAKWAEGEEAELAEAHAMVEAAEKALADAEAALAAAGEND